MAALVAALVIRATDSSSAFVSITANRTGKSGAVMVGAFIALCITQTFGAVIGALLSPHLKPDAARLLLGFALVAAGSALFWPAKPKAPRTARRPLLATVTFLVPTGLGDRTQVTTIAIAAGGNPAFAGIGGLIGSFIVLAMAAAAGEAVWQALPHRAARVSSGIVLVATGGWLAFSACGLL